MYFNGTGIWGGETMSMQKAIQVFLVWLTYSDWLIKKLSFKPIFNGCLSSLQLKNSTILIRKCIIENMGE